MGEFDKLEAALNRAGISEGKIKKILEWGQINDTDMLEVIKGGEDYVYINFGEGEGEEFDLNKEEAGKLFDAWGEFDKLEAALKRAGISEGKIKKILEWGQINDTDMLEVIKGGEHHVYINFGEGEGEEFDLNKEEAGKLFEAWRSQNGGKLKRRRRRKSKRKKSKRKKSNLRKSNRKRKKQTRRRSKKMRS